MTMEIILYINIYLTQVLPTKKMKQKKIAIEEKKACGKKLC